MRASRSTWPHAFAFTPQGRGGEFTRANRPLQVLGAQPFADRAQAQQAEYALKQLEKPEKLDWAQRWRWVDPGH